MPDQQNAADRLEAALDRIAQLARPAASSPGAVRDDAALAARLDQLIATLRGALDDEA